jgi:hypothetical protein
MPGSDGLLPLGENDVNSKICLVKPFAFRQSGHAQRKLLFSVLKAPNLTTI